MEELHVTEPEEQPDAHQVASAAVGSSPTPVTAVAMGPVRRRRNPHARAGDREARVSAELQMAGPI